MLTKFTGNAEWNELEWWSKEFSTRREWNYTNSIDTEKVEYDPKYSGVSWKYTTILKEGKLQGLTLGKCGFKIKGDKGFQQCGCGLLEFLSSKYKEPQKIRNYDFSKYSKGAIETTGSEEDSTRRKFDFKNVDFMDENNEFNPVQTDVTDSKYLFNNQDAIIVNFKKGNSSN